jgi:CheY-like chemotaxis protein
VDDITTNLDVAEGLLAPYQVQIHRTSGGPEAVSLIQKNQYDLVLMDHMMPGMDGIEAVGIIRSLEGEYFKTLPIVALTANAISGMREMYLEKGFNDYLSKPIEISRLDEIMRKWIPAEKKKRERRGKERIPDTGEEGASPFSGILNLLSEAGVDAARGIMMTGGTEAGYRKVLIQFNKNLVEWLPVFAVPPREVSPEVPGEPGLTFFTIQAHAIKGAAGTIGAAAVSEEAARLEAAGKSGDTETIRKLLPGFYERLLELAKGIGEAVKGTVRNGDGGVQGEKNDAGIRDYSLILEQAALLRRALEAKNIKDIDTILLEIENQPQESDIADSFSTLSDKILMGEYQDAINDIDHITNYIRTNKQEAQHGKRQQ